MIKLGLSGQFGLWNVCVLCLALLFFGFEAPTLIFALIVAFGASYLVLQLRNKTTRPISEIAKALTQTAKGQRLSLPILRGQTEIQQLAANLEEWAARAENQIQELSAARLRLESILGAMREGVLVFDKQHRIVLANDALGKLLRQSGSAVGKTCLELFRNEALDGALQDILDGRLPDSFEFQTGPDLTVRALLSPIPGVSGQPVDGVVSVLHDVTDIRQVERVRRDFVANVSHEFKTPLTSIRGYAETMMSGGAADQSHGFVEVIYRNARYLESLVNDLLELARLESEPASSPTQVNLRSVISEQVMLRRDSGGTSPAIDVDCPALEIQADRARLSKAISNLIGNALAYNRPGGRVHVVGRREGSDVVVEVTDSGYGIPEEELSRIFERFYRVDKARARNAGGTGLGLAIARHAIESQGGVLTVKSRVGIGSTFTIRLTTHSTVTDTMSRSVTE